jgi:hypothetical protein
MLIEDHLATVGESLKGLQVVVGKAGSAVQAQQRCPAFAD